MPVALVMVVPRFLPQSKRRIRKDAAFFLLIHCHCFIMELES